MRRESRKNSHDDYLNNKLIKYTGTALVILSIIVFGIFIYSKNLNNEVKEGTLTSKQLSSILNSSNTIENIQETTSEIGKSVEEAENEIVNSRNTQNNSINLDKEEVKENIVSTATITNNETDSNEIEKNIDKNTNINNETITNEVILDFCMPVEGEISKEFALESLLYSETLQEWTVHTGIDIKADKTTVVKSAEAGMIKSIKNDPRYGLTVVIEHADGFKTIYSNLLTAEFIVEGEKVEKGQSIGTVGNTAAFEIADTAHLHFEMMKDSNHVDPNIYLK